MRGSGDAFVTCRDGHRHWGRHGAAGLLLGASGRTLLQHRAPWTHEGGTWSVPGGARDDHEDVVTAALREAAEEAGLAPADVAPVGWSVADHGAWSYTTVVADLAAGRPAPAVHARNAESTQVRWWADGEVDGLALHAGLAASWPALRRRPAPLVVVVDLANVMGSRPDGWWRDRAGAAGRWWGELVGWVGRGVRDLPAGVEAGALTALTPRVRVVLEGAARAARTPAPDGGAGGWAARLVTAVRAAGSGDDAVLATAADVPAGHQVAVVTADRGLRDRVAAHVPAATVVGPRWLLDATAPRPA